MLKYSRIARFHGWVSFFTVYRYSLFLHFGCTTYCPGCWHKWLEALNRGVLWQGSPSEFFALTVKSISSSSARGIRIAQFVLFGGKIAWRHVLSIGWHNSPELLCESWWSLAWRIEDGNLLLTYVIYCKAEIVVLVDAQGRLSAQLVDLAGNIGVPQDRSQFQERRKRVGSSRRGSDACHLRRSYCSLTISLHIFNPGVWSSY